MGNLSNMLLIVFCLSAVFVLAGVVMHDINPNNNNVFYDCDKSIMSRYGSCTNNNLTNSFANTSATQLTVGNLPSIDTTQSSTVSVVVQTISNVFSSIGTWISDKLGFYYLQYALDAPRLVLNSLGFPPYFVWALAGLFTALIIFFFIDWMKGAFA